MPDCGQNLVELRGLKNADAKQRVLLNVFALFVGERLSFEQNLVTNTDLADVMQPGRQLYHSDLLLLHAQDLRERGGEFRYVLGVVPCVGVTCIHGGGQRSNGSTT